jgi:hypothetical protein
VRLRLVLLLTLALLGCRAEATDRVRGVADGARCFAEGAGDSLGGSSLADVRAAGTDVAEIGSRLADEADELRAAVDGCVDVRATLVGALRDAGLSDQKATCVADRALEDDKILGPLVVNLLFGDPGIATAVAIAVRAGGPCLTAEERDRLLPG